MCHSVVSDIVANAMQFVSESEKRLIGDAGDVSFTVTNGTEAMDVS